MLTRRSLKYVGGTALVMKLPSGREITVRPGDEIDAMPFDAKALTARPDFEELKEDDPDGTY